MADQRDSKTASAEQRLVERLGRGQVSWWEQAVAGLGAIVVVAVLGYLVWQLASEGSGPPTLRLQAGASRPAGTGYLLGFEVANDGDTTATSLEIVGRLERAGALVEQSRALIDYLPPASSRAGGLFFAHDPTQLTLVLQPGGYADP